MSSWLSKVGTGNWSGILKTANALLLRPRLLLPSCSAPDIRYINYEALRAAGYKAIVFDKDNTLTAPYSNHLFSTLSGALTNCRHHFGEGNLAILSNSAGSPTDPTETEALSLEQSLKLSVIRHLRWRKPSGGGEIAKHFGVHPCEVVVVGDRLTTDILMGNGEEMLTIHTRPLDISDDDWSGIWLRRMENFIIDNICRRPYSVPEYQDLFIAKEPIE